MLGKTILLTTDPQGTFSEGTISTASYPGTHMEIVPNTPFTNARPSYRPRSQVAGAAGPIIILLDDDFQGFPATTAYVAGTRGRLYQPLNGDEMNVLVADGPGTSYPITQGDFFSILANGMLYHVAVGGATSIPWQAMESIAALAVNTLCWCQYRLN